MNSEAVVQIERAGFAVIPDILDLGEASSGSASLWLGSEAFAGMVHRALPG
jgi:hypothetical protein